MKTTSFFWISLITMEQVVTDQSYTVNISQYKATFLKDNFSQDKSRSQQRIDQERLSA